jgi:hypothetical protein
LLLERLGDGKRWNDVPASSTARQNGSHGENYNRDTKPVCTQVGLALCRR